LLAIFATEGSQFRRQVCELTLRTDCHGIPATADSYVHTSKLRRGWWMVGGLLHRKLTSSTAKSVSLGFSMLALGSFMRGLL